LLGPRLLVVLDAGYGCAGTGPEDVDRYDAAQVRAAADHVFLRPDGGLEEAARGMDRVDAPNRVPEHLPRCRRGPRCLFRGRLGLGFGGERAAQSSSGVSDPSVGWGMSR
jgi:hypothetical protein